MLRQTALSLFFLIVILASPSVCKGEDGFGQTRSGDFLPGFEQILEEHPLLAEGGGTLLADGEDWIAVGIGTGVDADGKQSEHSLWKIADQNALTSLAEAFGGSAYSGTDSAKTVDGALRASSAMIRETAGIVSGSREAGRWKSGRGKVYHVMRAVFSPGHPLLKARMRFPAQNIEIDAPWQEEFLSRAFLRNGGADVAALDGRVYLLVVGTAPLKDASSTARIAASRVADVKARANLLAFYDGVRMRASTEATTFQSKNRIEEKLQSRSSVQIRGIAGRMKSVGGWLSGAGDALARAYVVDSDDL